MKITKIDIKDISQIRSMWEELNKIHGRRSTYFKDHFESFSFEERQKQLLSKPCIAIFAARDQDHTIGYCIASIENGIGEIDSIYISPDYQDRGVGAILISASESWLTSQGVIKIRVCVAEGNESVFNFYHKQGYYQRFIVLEKKA